MPAPIDRLFSTRLRRSTCSCFLISSRLGHSASETLAQAWHEIFRRWLGVGYDIDALDATLATAAAERLGGDPLWFLLVSGPGNAKTETVQSLSGVGAVVTSTITSEGALLSGTPKRERTGDATGGLLRKLGERGILVIKDLTTILSMHRDARAGVLAALREIHDGRWERNLGVNCGRTLTWIGRIAVVGAVTTAWDAAHAVISTMGDRFVLMRMDSTRGRSAAGRQAINNIGHEPEMREVLANAVAGVLASVDPTHTITLTDAERDQLLAAADLTTRCRTAIESDYKGTPLEAHAPEMPTRFSKQLAQVVRGAVAIGMDRRAAMRLAMRCAKDSMPPMRLAILDDLAQNPRSRTADVWRRLDKPRWTVDRQLQALHLLGLITLEESVAAESLEPGAPVPTKWLYTLAEGVTTTVFDGAEMSKRRRC